MDKFSSGLSQQSISLYFLKLSNPDCAQLCTPLLTVEDITLRIQSLVAEKARFTSQMRQALKLRTTSTTSIYYKDKTVDVLMDGNFFEVQLNFCEY